MPKLVKDNQIATDDWNLVEVIENLSELSAGKNIVPLSFWLENVNTLSGNTDVGVWLNGDEDVSLLADYVNQLALIAIRFPVFMDGRGFSSARILRERYLFSGELRAIGNFIRDQLAYLQRCGFNAFSLSDEIDPQGALKSLNDFSEYYQSAVDQPQPLFRRRG